MKRSFTLIELLIVLVIIGVLTMLAVPKFEKMVLKSKMMKRVPILEQIRVAERAYKDETGSYFLADGWVEPGGVDGNADVDAVEKALGVKIPVIKDDSGDVPVGNHGGPSSFVILYSAATSGWWRNDPRFAGYAYYSYASQGEEAAGGACIIACYDDNLNVKKLSIKYRIPEDVQYINAPVDDIAVNE